MSRVYDNSGIERVSGSELNSAPSISSLSPSFRYIEEYTGASVDVTITGTGFISSSSGRVDGTSRSTTFVSATTLIITLLASDVVAVGTLDITVSTPSPGGGVSSASTFRVRWDPSKATTQLWLDMNDVSTITEVSGVSQWDDKSGNGHSFVQSDTSEQPIIQSGALNSMDVLRFDGSDDALADNADDARDIFRNVSYGAEFIVYKKNSEDGGDTSRIMTAFFTDSNTARFFTRAGYSATGAGNEPTLSARRLDGDSQSNMVTGTPLFTTWAVASFVLDWSAGDGFIYIDGTQAASDTSFTSSGSTSNTRGSRAATIGGFASQSGGSPNTAANADVDIAEIVLFDSSLSAAEREQIEGYLAWKWGLEGNLAGGHTYESVPP